MEGPSSKRWKTLISLFSSLLETTNRSPANSLALLHSTIASLTKSSSSSPSPPSSILSLTQGNKTEITKCLNEWLSLIRSRMYWSSSIQVWSTPISLVLYVYNQSTRTTCQLVYEGSLFDKIEHVSNFIRYSLGQNCILRYEKKLVGLPLMHCIYGWLPRLLLPFLPLE